MGSALTTIILALISVIGGNLGIEWLKDRKSKRKELEEGKVSVQRQLTEHMAYVDRKLRVAEERYDRLVVLYNELQQKDIDRQAVLKNKEYEMKIIMDNLNQVKAEYEALKNEYIGYRERLDKEYGILQSKYRALEDRMTTVEAEKRLLEATLGTLQRAQTTLETEVHGIEAAQSISQPV